MEHVQHTHTRTHARDVPRTHTHAYRCNTHTHTHTHAHSHVHAGIAVEFVKRFGNRETLRAQKAGIGEVQEHVHVHG